MKKLNQDISIEHLNFLKSQKLKNIKIMSFRLLIILLLVIFWETSTRLNLIDPFIVSSPSRIFNTISILIINNELWQHISITLFETILGFIFGTLLGMLIAIILWWSETISKILEPYLIVLNALPKVALGPIILIWFGSGIKSIIIMAILISLIVSTMNILVGFENVSKEKILLMKSFGANKLQILFKVMLPANVYNIISTLKINIGMSLIGVITGEFLVATKGIGYLIIYGGQIFKLDLVMTGIVILSVLAALIYYLISKIETAYIRFKD